MTAVLSNDCSSAIPSTMTTFFHTLASDNTLLESTADASFPIKVIRVLFVKQCNISPSTTLHYTTWRLISGRDWHTIMRRANKHRSSFNSNIFLFTTIFVFFVAFFQVWSLRFFIGDHRFSLPFWMCFVTNVLKSLFPSVLCAQRSSLISSGITT